MLDGMKYATQGMMLMSQMQDVVTNNLANATTPGYHKESLSVTAFSDVLDKQMGAIPGKGQAGWTGYMQVGTDLDTQNQLFSSTRTSYAQGSLRETGNPFDLAMQDKGGVHGFFNVRTPDGKTLFTRNGSFKLQEGKLVTADGCALMGKNGPIQVGHGTKVEVKPNGEVMVDDRQVDTLRVTVFQDPRVLQKNGATTFTAPSDKGMTLTSGFSVQQGFLEAGNVNAVQEMVDMMQIMRAYEANQKMLQTQDQVLRKAANELGKVR